MIKLFKENDTTFNSNGDLIIKPTRAIVHKEDNGSFYLDLETNLNEEKKIVEPEAGTTIEITNGSQIQNVDTSKEISVELLGNTTQETTTGKNLFRNSDTFEGNSSNGWVVGGTIDTTTTKDGSYSLRTYSAWQGAGANLKQLYEQGKISIGDTLTFSVYFKTNFVPFGPYSFSFTLYRATGSAISVANFPYADIVPDTWYRISGSFVVDSNSITQTNARIEANFYDKNDVYYFGNNRENYIWFSQYQLEKSSSATRYEKYTFGPSPNPNYLQKISTFTGNQKINASTINKIGLTPLTEEHFVSSNATTSEWVFDSELGRNVYHIGRTTSQSSSYPQATFELPTERFDPTGKNWAVIYRYKFTTNLPSDWGAGAWINFSGRNNWEVVGINSASYVKDLRILQNTNEWTIGCCRISKDNSEYANYPTTSYKYMSICLGAKSTAICDLYVSDIMCIEITDEEYNATTYTPPEFVQYASINSQINLGKNLCTSAEYYSSNGANLWTNSKLLQQTFTLSFIAPQTTNSVLIIPIAGSTTLPQIGAFNMVEGERVEKTITLTNDIFRQMSQYETCRITLYKNNAGWDTSKPFQEVQIENGNSFTGYSEYTTPIELCKVGEYQDFIRKGQGYNLFDISTINENKYVSGVDGQLYDSNASNSTDYISVVSGKNYTISYNYNSLNSNGQRAIVFYDINKNWLSYIVYNSTDKIATFTIPSNAFYVRITLDKGYYDTMIYEGNSTLTYEPYGLKDKWYLYKATGKIVLNGTESDWVKYTPLDTTNYNCYYLPLNTLYVDSTGSTQLCLSNYFTGVSFNNKGTDTANMWVNKFAKQLTLKIQNTITTIAELKTWLSTHNTIVYYILSTPTTTEITNQDLIDQLENIKLANGTNDIEIISGGVPSIIDLTYNAVSGGEITTSYIDYLQPNRILVANTPQGEQAFRIGNVEKTRSKIRLQANHVFYDSANYIIKDSFVVEKNCNDALDHLNNATDQTTPFTMTSDINTIASYRCVRNSLYEAIKVVLERWGGHLVRNNFNIGIMNSIGNDNGVVVRYGKNLKDINASYDWSAVATKLMPVGQDGLLLPEEWLYSNIEYEIPYTKVVSFDQSNVEQDNYMVDDELDEEAYQQALIDDLRAKGNEYLATNSVPMVNYTLEANLERISDVGDTIEVIDEKLGINLLTHLISFEYNCILDKYVQVQFGNFTPTLSGLMQTIAETTSQAIDESNAVLRVSLSNELQQATDSIWSVLGNSYVIYDGDKILVLDRLPKETAQNVIMINAGGIGFSNTGIDGTFTSAWTIDNTLNMQNVNVINLTADLIKGGTLKLGSNLNQYGQIEIYNETNNLIAEMNKNGLKMYGADGSYVLMNNQVGFAGYDRNGTKIYWADGDAFHMKKSEVEEEITLCGKMRYIPIQITDNGTITNDGIGLVSVLGGGN